MNVPWPLLGRPEEDGRLRLGPSARRRRQTLSRLRWGQEVGDHEGEVVEGEVGGPAQGADHGALLLGGLPGQPVRPCGAVQAVRRAALAPLADGLGAHPEAPGQHAARLARAGDLGADGRGGAGVGMDLEHGSCPFLRRRPEALEAVGVVYDGQPDRIPTMLRDQTPNTTWAVEVPGGRSVLAALLASWCSRRAPPWPPSFTRAMLKLCPCPLGHERGHAKDTSMPRGRPTPGAGTACGAPECDRRPAGPPLGSGRRLAEERVGRLCPAGAFRGDA